jgi:hypothetical protein
MKKIIVPVLVIFAAFAAWASEDGPIIKCSIVDIDGSPISDVRVFADCRENCFFTDEIGEVLVRVEGAYADCILDVSHSAFCERSYLVETDTEADTVPFVLHLYRPGETEPVGPTIQSGRFSSITQCGVASPQVKFDIESQSFIASIPKTSKGAVSDCCIQMSDSESEASKGVEGYDLENIDYMSFSARSLGDPIEVTFGSLSFECDAAVGSYPSMDVVLSGDFQTFSIDITRWSRSSVKVILGWHINEDQVRPDTQIEIKDIGIHHSDPPSVSQSSAVR